MNCLFLRLRTLGCLSYLALFIVGIPALHAANWQIDSRLSLPLDSGTETVSEMSGVTYLGESPTPGLYRFAAVQDSGGKVITIDVEFSPTGSLVSASAVGSLTLAMDRDFEGIAYTNPTRNSVYIADEPLAAIREFNFNTGEQLQVFNAPSVFNNLAPNFGFESLTRSPDGSRMWTANEEALTVDGDVSNSTAGTTVRLLEIEVAGNDLTAGRQFAYEVEKIHSPALANRSGLSDLVYLPDGTLLALERSAALVLGGTSLLSRIYEVELSEATDLHTGPLADGLQGQTYTPVGKELLWGGAAAGTNGENLEGLALGPRLANGSWVLLGVVDDDDPFSNNTIVAFVLSSVDSADFDHDGDVDGDDFLLWQRGFGKTVGANHSEGDADRDGDVDSDDLEIWKNNYPKNSQLFSLPEPHTFVSTLFTAFLAAHAGVCRFLARFPSGI